MAVRKNLKSFRGSLCLTQSEMADRIGVRPQLYAYVEQGRLRGSMDFWTGLQKAFNVPDATMWKLQQEGELDEESNNDNSAD